MESVHCMCRPTLALGDAAS